MSSDELSELLEQMPAIAEAVNAFKSETVQEHAFRSLVGAFFAKGGSAGLRHVDVVARVPQGQRGDTSSGSAKGSNVVNVVNVVNVEGWAERGWASSQTARGGLKNMSWRYEATR